VTSAASAGPDRLAALKLIASSAEARESSAGVTTVGSWEVQPPATAGLSDPAASAQTAATTSGTRPTVAAITRIPVA
jgi:hypothetical protein